VPSEVSPGIARHHVSAGASTGLLDAILLDATLTVGTFFGAIFLTAGFAAFGAFTFDAGAVAFVAAVFVFLFTDGFATAVFFVTVSFFVAACWDVFCLTAEILAVSRLCLSSSRIIA